MFPYWLLFAYFALGALISRGVVGKAMPDEASLVGAGDGPNPYAGQPGPIAKSDPFLRIGFIAITLMAGLRYEVGGDWSAYLLRFRQTSALPFDAALKLTDAGYQAVSWICAQVA